ncbi:hypothetical protein [Pantoea septica]|uniref:hypothetical protein n=1 Tax=Pantoea septica TaxID=472695 RepID=UPI003D009C87
MSGVFASTAAAVGIIDKALTITKKLSDNSPELDKATLKLELANLMVELASVKMEVISLQALVFDAEQKNKELEEKLKDKDTFTFKSGVYWKDGDDTAFCPKCWENDGKKLHMLARLRKYGGMGSSVEKPNWYCRVCKTSVNRV